MDLNFDLYLESNKNDDLLWFWGLDSSYLQLLYAVFELRDGLLQLIHGSHGEQVMRGVLCGAVPHHDALQGRFLQGAEGRCAPAPTTPAQPLLALGQLPRQLPDGPLVRQDLVLLLQDRLPELLGGGAQVPPVLPRVQRRVIRLLLKVSGVALPSGDRGADEPADGRVVPGESSEAIQADVEGGRLRIGTFRTVESSQGSHAGGGVLRSRVREQRAVVGRGLPLRRSSPGGSGVDSRDDADNRSDEGHHPGGQDNNDKLQFGGGSVLIRNQKQSL